jgi:hypothetical protein
MSISISVGEIRSCSLSLGRQGGPKRRRDMSSGSVLTRGLGGTSEAARSKSAADSALKRSSSHGRLPVISAIAICGGLLKNTDKVASNMHVHMPAL